MKRLILMTGFVVVVSAIVVSCDKISPPLPELQKSTPKPDDAKPKEVENKALAPNSQK